MATGYSSDIDIVTVPVQEESGDDYSHSKVTDRDSGVIVIEPDSIGAAASYFSRLAYSEAPRCTTGTVTVSTTQSSLFQQISDKIEVIRSENYDTTQEIKDAVISIQRNVELLKAKQSANDHESKQLRKEVNEGFRIICEKIDEQNQVKNIAQNIEEIRIIEAQNIPGQKSNTEEKINHEGVDGSDIRTQYEAEFISDHLGKTKVTVHLGEHLGEGAFGEVFKFKLPNGLYAAKFLTWQFINKYPDKLYTEINILKKCDHQNVVKYIASCEIPGISYSPDQSTAPVLIMELMETSFEKYFKTSNPKPTLECTVRILEQVADGLDYLHTKCKPKIVHRDLTANNVLLNQNTSSAGFTAKIADFGLSRFVESIETVVSMTRMRGTRYYSAPEVDTVEHHYNEKVDIFSFGHLALVSIINQIIKQLPDVRQDKKMYLTEIARRVKYFEDLRHKLTSEYDDLETLIKSCLEMNHNDRPTAAELAQILKPSAA